MPILQEKTNMAGDDDRKWKWLHETERFEFLSNKILLEY